MAYDGHCSVTRHLWNLVSHCHNVSYTLLPCDTDPSMLVSTIVLVRKSYAAYSSKACTVVSSMILVLLLNWSNQHNVWRYSSELKPHENKYQLSTCEHLSAKQNLPTFSMTRWAHRYALSTVAKTCWHTLFLKHPNCVIGRGGKMLWNPTSQC